MVGTLKATSVNHLSLLESTMAEYNVMRDCRSVGKEIGTTALVCTLKNWITKQNSNVFFIKKWIILVLNKSLYWFLNVEDDPRMSCRLCYFGENICEKLFLLEFAARLLGGPPCFLLILDSS